MNHPELLRTKLFIPASKSTVQRPQLYRSLTESLQNRLTLIIAPAGYGKSTLLSDWIRFSRESEDPHHPAFVPAWFSIDEADSDTKRFFTYFIAALQCADGSVGRDVSLILEAADEINIESILTILINEITSLPMHIVLVLDDYHLIEFPLIDQALSFFLEHIPDNMHLIVSSRIDPSFALSRLRARGQMVEIRAAHLRFSQAEIGEFFNQAGNIDLSENQVEALEARTEGWIAGLQLAALSMKGTDDLDGFVESFTGSHRYIIDYLGDEVLSGLSDEILDFLLKTSVLSGLTGSLCDALTGRSDGAAMLDMLEQRNLFITVLDNERRWFRYHHLFADLLKRRLEHTEPSHVAELHLKAGEWHHIQGDFQEAFRHFMQSGDIARAVELLEGRWQIFVYRGQTGQLQNMLKSLKPVDIDKSAPLSMAQCWLCCFEERFDKIPPHLKNVYRALDNTSIEDSNPAPRKLAVIPLLAETMEAVVSFECDRLDEMKMHAQKAISLIPKTAPRSVQGLLYCTAGYWLALAYERLGETDQACALHLEMIGLMTESGSQMSAANSLLEISRIYLRAGRLKELIELCEQMLADISERGWEKLPPTGVTMLILARALRLVGSSDKAEKYFTEGRELIRPIMGPRFNDLVDPEDPGRMKSASNSLLVEPLSLRELEVLRLLARGFSNSEICEQLYLALSTVKGHNRNIFDKLQVKSRTEAALRAREMGLTQ